jgi:hypothetical protein
MDDRRRTRDTRRGAADSGGPRKRPVRARTATPAELAEDRRRCLAAKAVPHAS